MKSSNCDKINFVLKITSIYAVLMLAMLVISLYIAFNLSNTNDIVTEEKIIQTEYVYVVKDETADTEAIETDERKTYTVREHMDMIGIFDENGALIKVLEIYVKTLPEYDQRMLKEGFVVVGTKQLNAIIEDYDG